MVKSKCGTDGQRRKNLFINQIEKMTTQSNVVATSAASQPMTQDTTSVNEQIKSCNRLIETLISKNSKLEKRMKEMA